MDNIELLQYYLNKQFKAGLDEDGKIGDNTLDAIHKFLPELTPKKYNQERLVIATLQTLAKKESIETGEVDGLMGPQTKFAIKQLISLKNDKKLIEPWRDEEPIHVPDVNWPLQNTADLIKYFGPVGSNQVKIKLPHPVRIAWDKSSTTSSITCHEKVADSISRILDKVLDHYGPDKYKSLGMDLFGGCLNVRQIRGGTRYSTHSWGIAIDWDPERNQLKWNKTKANFAKPEYNKWWDIWEDEGWLSLGRAKDFDWMHVQACRIK